MLWYSPAQTPSRKYGPGKQRLLVQLSSQLVALILITRSITHSDFLAFSVARWMYVPAPSQTTCALPQQKPWLIMLGQIYPTITFYPTWMTGKYSHEKPRLWLWKKRNKGLQA